MGTTTTVADSIREAFKYWETVPPLAGYLSVSELEREYCNQSGACHWFDPATLRFFGSRNRHLIRPGVLVETQTKAPSTDMRYRVTAFVIDATAARDHRSMGRITPVGLGWFGSLTAARRFAAAAADLWPALVGSVVAS
jgi:hypothetical protein